MSVMEAEGQVGEQRPGTVVEGRAPSTWDLAARHCSRWRSGDPAGLDDLVRLMTPVLWQIARACSLDPAEAEDVVQTTWLALVRSRDRLRDPQAVGGWLTSTARREAWRVSGRARTTTDVEDSALDLLVPAARSSADEAVEADERTRLWRAVAALDARCQTLLRVVAFTERPDYASLSRDLGMPVGSIGPTRQRCLGKLRALLSSQEEGS